MRLLRVRGMGPAAAVQAPLAVGRVPQAEHAALEPVRKRSQPPQRCKPCLEVELQHCHCCGVFARRGVDGVVYVGSNNGNVYALNASTGALLWSYATGAYVSSSPAVANRVVYVGSADNSVYALNASTGALLWSYITRGFVAGSPALSNGVVYVGS